MAGTSEIIHKGLRKYDIEKIYHNMKKTKIIVNTFFSPLFNTEARDLYGLYQMQIHSLIKQFSKVLSKSKCVFRIRKNQLHERSCGCSDFIVFRANGSCNTTLKKSGEAMLCLGSTFPNVNPKLIDNTGE